MASPGTARDEDDYRQALALRAGGHAQQASAVCDGILARSPAFAPALHLAGVLALEAGRLDRAAHFLPAAVRANPGEASAHHSLGLLFRAGGKHRDAVIAFRAALQRDPRHVPAWNGLGLSLLDGGDPEAAARAFRSALEAGGPSATTRHNLGLALERQGRAEEAAQAYRAATEADPALHVSRLALGRTLLQLEQLPEAEAALRDGLERDPGSLETRAALAVTLEAQGRDAEAEALLRAAPDASHPVIAINLGNLLARGTRFAEAIELYDAASPRARGDAVILHNRANALAGLGRIDAAMAGWEAAIAAAPTYRDPHFALSRWLLARGELEAGWREFAWRPLELPSWLPRAGLARASDAAAVERAAREKFIELVEEQGLGDVIFFLQWAPWLMEQGWRVTLRVSARLAPLLARAARFELRSSLDAPLGEDCIAIPTGDLPELVVRMGGPGESVGTLHLEPLPDRLQAARQALTEAGPAPYTGLTWRAGVARRSVGRDMLSKEVDPQLLWESLDTPGTLVAMQRGLRAGELDLLRRFAPCVADFEAWTQDLESLLGLLAALDGYAGVSSTNVHLLGLLGRHATIAVPNPPEWRWAGEVESRWFPGLTVVRQRPGESWDEAFAALAASRR